MKFNVERLDWTQASGWAFSPDSKLMIEAWHNETSLGKIVTHLARHDVAADFPGQLARIECGFVLPLNFPVGVEEIEVLITATHVDDNEQAVGKKAEIARRLVVSVNRLSKIITSSAQETSTFDSPFPAKIAAMLRGLLPGFGSVGNDEQLQAIAIEKLIELAGMIEMISTGTDALLDYFRYLRNIKNHFTFVAKYFPAVNQDVSPSDKDRGAKPNSAKEMLNLAHHLYVLKSYGVVGDFAEFGCFKGFSASMLSYACSLIGVKLHVFDSFEGLPKSNSTYYKAGEFKGSLNEVEANLHRFGQLSSVEFHKGFFAESLPAMPRIRLMSLWLDVDLVASARDVMLAFDKVDRRGAIFSHECGSERFSGTTVIPGPDVSDNVVPAIINMYQSRGVEPAGRHLTLKTGAFWRKGEGLPVLCDKHLSRLLTSI
jgi:O-methyltransferase